MRERRSTARGNLSLFPVPKNRPEKGGRKRGEEPPLPSLLSGEGEECPRQVKFKNRRRGSGAFFPPGKNTKI